MHMPLEDILQNIYDKVAGGIRVVGSTGGGAGGATETTAAAIKQMVETMVDGPREHLEQAIVPNVYDAAHCKMEFSTPKRHIRITSREDVYWVDSANSDADAQTKLTTAGQHGFIVKQVPLVLHLEVGITRLDFLARNREKAVHVTGT